MQSPKITKKKDIVLLQDNICFSGAPEGRPFRNCRNYSAQAQESHSATQESQQAQVSQATAQVSATSSAAFFELQQFPQEAATARTATKARDINTFFMVQKFLLNNIVLKTSAKVAQFFFATNNF
ncbi:MAG: hypothetical protein PUA47_06540 [Bacteroidales bacterium]|nr:hypothetical protein [Bacteroidales bacterium]